MRVVRDLLLLRRTYRETFMIGVPSLPALDIPVGGMPSAMASTVTENGPSPFAALITGMQIAGMQTPSSDNGGLMPAGAPGASVPQNGVPMQLVTSATPVAEGETPDAKADVPTQDSVEGSIVTQDAVPPLPQAFVPPAPPPPQGKDLSNADTDTTDSPDQPAAPPVSSSTIQDAAKTASAPASTVAAGLVTALPLIVGMTDNEPAVVPTAPRDPASRPAVTAQQMREPGTPSPVREASPGAPLPQMANDPFTVDRQAPAPAGTPSHASAPQPDATAASPTPGAVSSGNAGSNAGAAPTPTASNPAAPAMPAFTPQASSEATGARIVATSPAADDAPVPMEQIALRIAARAAKGEHHFDIRLDPPELGRIDVRLSVDAHGHARTILSAEKPHTLDVLQRDAATLERTLRDAGLDTGGGLSFSLKGDGRQASDTRGAVRTRNFGFVTGLAPDSIAIPPAGAGWFLSDTRIDIRV